MTANHPLAAVFVKGGSKHLRRREHLHVAPLTVTFSDGTRVTAPAGKTVGLRCADLERRQRRGGSGNAAAHQHADADSHQHADGHSDRTPTATPTGRRRRPRRLADPTATPTTTPTAPTRRASYYLRADGRLGASAPAAGTVSLAAANCQCDGTPTKARAFAASGVTRDWPGGPPTFDLFVDAGTSVGSATQVRISYDLTGNG